MTSTPWSTASRLRKGGFLVSQDDHDRADAWPGRYSDHDHRRRSRLEPVRERGRGAVRQPPHGPDRRQHHARHGDRPDPGGRRRRTTPDRGLRREPHPPVPEHRAVAACRGCCRASSSSRSRRTPARRGPVSRCPSTVEPTVDARTTLAAGTGRTSGVGSGAGSARRAGASCRRSASPRPGSPRA